MAAPAEIGGRAAARPAADAGHPATAEATAMTAGRD